MVYAHRLWHFQAIKDDMIPRKAILDDLKVEIEEWKKQGESIVMMGYFTGSVIKEYRESIQLRDISINWIGEGGNPANWHFSKDPIDTTIYTPNVVIKNAAYLPFKVELCSHR